VHNIHQKFDRQRERTESKSIIIVISQHKDPLNKSSMPKTFLLIWWTKAEHHKMSHKFSLHLAFISKLPFQKARQEKTSNNWLLVEKYITNNITLEMS
jgi:hypothetical protein